MHGRSWPPRPVAARSSSCSSRWQRLLWPAFSSMATMRGQYYYRQGGYGVARFFGGYRGAVFVPAPPRPTTCRRLRRPALVASPILAPIPRPLAFIQHLFCIVLAPRPAFYRQLKSELNPKSKITIAPRPSPPSPHLHPSAFIPHHFKGPLPESEKRSSSPKIFAIFQPFSVL
jgi:hypothetical protein